MMASLHPSATPRWSKCVLTPLLSGKPSRLSGSLPTRHAALLLFGTSRYNDDFATSVIYAKIVQMYADFVAVGQPSRLFGSHSTPRPAALRYDYDFATSVIYASKVEEYFDFLPSEKPRPLFGSP